MKVRRWIFPEPAHPRVALALAVLLVIALGAIDLLTKAEFSTEIFYLVPIFLSTWLSGLWGGVFISLLSALAWLANDIPAAGDSHPAVPYWDVFVRLVSFLLIAYLFSELRLARERRRNLERIFFHDIFNVIGTIRGAAELLPNIDPADRLFICRMIMEASDQAVDEISAQRTMAAIENDELEVQPAPVNSKALLEQVIDWYRHHRVGQNRAIELSPTTREILFESDQALLYRILGNMLKNALEAVSPEEKVTMGCAPVRDGVEFWVHNPGVVPDSARKEIFQRSASAKGYGRGMGTYSMRILSEQLKGKVSFSSTEEEGTTFRAWYPLELP